MIRKTLPLLCAALLLVATAASSAQTKAHRVLFALSSSDEVDWKITLNNLRALLTGMAPEPVEIEVIAFGPGVSFFKKDTAEAHEIHDLEARHIRFIACENALRNQHLQLSDLLPGVETVPAGIVEIVRKQEAGWTYIKAGR